MAKQDDYVRYTIRVPAGLYARLQDAAGEKSVNAEIVERLDRSFRTLPVELGLEFVQAIENAPPSKLKELQEGIADLLDFHFPNAVIELRPEELWEMQMAMVRELPEEYRPAFLDKALELSRLLAKDPTWEPPTQEDRATDEQD
ncbi:hypothetical protein [Pelagibacterium halotolerans]|uniref:hypothetical protein n=1 Tax=Pelagibacterium halotolerans TaxID=531813 RepID=UPI00384B8413